METSLDKKDRKIMRELDMEGRLPLSIIAKRVGLSKEVVNYRVNKLQSQGIVRGFYTIVDAISLGYLVGKFMIKLHGISSAMHKEFVGYCKDNPGISWVVLLEGAWNIGLIIQAKDIRKINDVWTDLQLRYGTYIDSTTIVFSTKAAHFPYRHLYGADNSKRIIIGDVQGNAIDADDTKILNAISVDARIPLTDLAKKVKMRPAKTRYHLNEMIRKGIIKGFRTSFDDHKLGFMYYKIFLFLNSCTKERYKGLYNHMAAHPNVTMFVENLAPFMAEISVVVKSTLEIYDFISELQASFSDIIKSHKSVYTSHFVKISYF
jgi:Lrp/AsnC family transcriptional regulator, leucine-responsive regulatory protein